MATGKMKLTVIDVGQGQCTFMELYDDTSPTPKLINTLLFDCGSNKKSDVTEANLDYIAQIASSKKTPGFDAIFFSHSDTDHTNLTKDLLDKIQDKIKPKKLAIGEVWFAGAHSLYTKKVKAGGGWKSFNILDHIEEKGYCATNEIYALDSNYSGYDVKSDSFTAYLWRTSDKALVVRPIVANALSAEPDWDENNEDVTGHTAEEKNRISLICGLFYKGSSYVICGDATNATMAAVADKFSKPNSTIFDNNKMSTLPHHGSRRTGLAVDHGKDASDEAIKVVKTFAKLLKSRYLTDSAYEKHRHPSLELMSLFPPVRKEPFLRDPRLKQKNSHRFTAYNDIDVKTNTLTLTKSAAYTFETLTNTFTTRYWDETITYSYNLGDKNAKSSEGVVKGEVINPFACWAFIIRANGETTIEGYADMNKADFTVGATTSEEQTVPTPLLAAPIPRPPAAPPPQFQRRLKQFR